MTQPGNTLADFPTDQFTIWAICNACGRQVALDRDLLPAGLRSFRMCLGDCAMLPVGQRTVVSGSFTAGRVGIGMEAVPICRTG